MAVALTVPELSVRCKAALTNPLDLSTPLAAVDFARTLAWSTGTGANQADRIWHDRRTLAGSGTENIDLAGSLTDALGQAVTFAKVRGLIVSALATNTNNVLVGGDATSTWFTWVVAETDTVIVRPGGILALFAPDATAYAVTATTADLLKLTNSAGGTDVTFDIIIIGASA